MQQKKTTRVNLKRTYTHIHKPENLKKIRNRSGRTKIYK